jgi:hypothetical protein
MKKPLTNQGLKGGAGEEGRTPDLMLGNDTNREKAEQKVDETLYFSRLSPAAPLFVP